MTRRTIIATLAAASFCITAGAQVVNGSFESTPSGTLPTGWTLTGGTAIVSSLPDSLFPSDGGNYLLLTNATTGPLTAGCGPHVAGSCGQMVQVVTRPPTPKCSLSIDWEFLPGEILPSPMFNDFLSIDVIHDVSNALLASVVFIDTGLTAGTVPYANVPGAATGTLTYVPNQSTIYYASGNQAPAGFKRAYVDLSAVPVGTAMRIEISVANGGDGNIVSRAYIDNVRLLGGERNTATASLRILGSSHQDGIGLANDWSGDLRTETPYTFQVTPGQRLSVRATSIPGSPWALVGGVIQEVGTVHAGVGVANLDVNAQLFTVINGFDVSNPLSTALGTIGATGTSFYDAQVPANLPPGVKLGVQAIMQDLTNPSGLRLTAATSVEVVSAQMPFGTTIAAGANMDDGTHTVTFGAFGAWPFFGVARPQIFIDSNGYVSFASIPSNHIETELAMVTGPARIALAWDDLYNRYAGTAPVKTSETNTTFTVSYDNTVECGTSLNGNSFAMQLYNANGPTPGGVFTIYYGAATLSDGLVGISPGGLPAPGPGVSVSTNLSATAFSLGARGVVPAGAPLIERFAFGDVGVYRDLFDMMTIGGGTARITFVPDGAGGYTFFTGTR